MLVRFSRTGLLAASVLLAACGGGGGDSAAPSTPGSADPGIAPIDISAVTLCINGESYDSGATLSSLPSGSQTGITLPGVNITGRSAGSDEPFRGIEVTASLEGTGNLSLSTGSGETVAEDSSACGNAADGDGGDDTVEGSGWEPGGLSWTGELTISEHDYSFSFAEIAPIPDLEAPPVALTAQRIDGIFMLRGPNIDGLILMRVPDCSSSRNCDAWHLNPRYEPSWYGLDEFFNHANAHLESHYHGLSEAPLADYDGLLRQVGMAADGYPIANGWFDDGGLLRRATSSYQLKTGERAPGLLMVEPVGPYNGEYVEDYEYVEGSGDLDECNGMVVNGIYTYFMTADFPYLMNCLRGTPHASFQISAP